MEGLGCAIGGVFFSAKREKNLLGGRQGREEREETIFAITPTHT